MIEFFSDWKKVTGTFQENTVTKNAAGQPVESWTAVSGGEDLSLNFWIDTAIETDSSDKFVGKRRGTVLLKIGTIDPDTNMRILIDSKYYYITGVNNIAGFNDFYEITWVSSDV